MIRNLMRAVLVLVCAELALVSGTAMADPPARVARLAYIQGPVSFAPAGEDEWVVATPNRPLVTGDRIWADAAARTELQVGSATVRLGATTSATLLNLDDRIAQFEVAQGTVYVNARRLAPNEVVEIDTPNLALSITRPGTYRIDVDANGDSTAVGVRGGEAEVYGEGAAYVIPSGQYYRFYATGLQQRQYSALAAPDEFDQWASTRDQRYDNVAAAQYVAPDVIGYQDLDEYGTWSSVPEYGNVWTPNRVAADWAPYRDGRWSWIDPWGWTWVDSEPWGFAPYHYGRWAYARDRWCWVPGPRTARAVYAPALVAFVGGPNFSLSISAGPSAGIAWFPLAPGEVYRPAYRVSRDYFTRVNVSNTQVNTTIINNYYNNSNVTNVVYRNRQAPRAVTAVPHDVFVQSRPVAASRVNVATVDLAKLQVTSVAPVAPSRASVLGATQPAPHRPSDQSQRREVVAKTKPAPAPASFEQKAQALARQPGRPLDTNVAASTSAAAKADERRVKVVTASRRPEPAPKGPDTAAQGKGQPPVAAQRGVPPPAAPGVPGRQESASKQQDQQRAQEARQQQEQQRGEQAAKQPEQQRGQQAQRQQQDQQRAQQQEQQRAQQADKQQEQQRAQQAQRQQQDQTRAQQQEQQRGQQAAKQQQDQQRAQQQEQQRGQQAAKQQQDQQRAQQQEQQRAQQAAKQQDQQRAQQQEQQRAQQAARQQQDQQRVQQAARQQQDQQRAQQAARQQQEQQRAQQAQRQEQQRAQQAARQQQDQQRAQQQEQQRAQQAQRQQQEQRAQPAERQAPQPKGKGKDDKRDEDRQAQN